MHRSSLVAIRAGQGECLVREFREHILAQPYLGRIATGLSARRLRNQTAHAMHPVFRSNQVT